MSTVIKSIRDLVANLVPARTHKEKEVSSSKALYVSLITQLEELGFQRFKVDKSTHMNKVQIHYFRNKKLGRNGIVTFVARNGEVQPKVYHVTSSYLNSIS